MAFRGAGSGERYPPWQSGELFAGFTLVEVLLVITILGLVFGVSGLAFFSLRVPRESDWIRDLRLARAQAIRTGHPVSARDDRSPLTGHVLFLPDGRALGTGIDPLTGAPVD